MSRCSPKHVFGFDSAADMELWRHIVQLVKANHSRFGSREDCQDAAVQVFQELKGKDTMVLREGWWKPRAVVSARLRSRTIDVSRKRKNHEPLQDVLSCEMPLAEDLERDRLHEFVCSILTEEELAALAFSNGYPPDIIGVKNAKHLESALGKLRKNLLCNPEASFDFVTNSD